MVCGYNEVQQCDAVYIVRESPYEHDKSEIRTSDGWWGKFRRNTISLRLDYHKRFYSIAVGYALHANHQISTNLSPITGVFRFQVQTSTQSKKQTWPTKSYQIMGERVKVLCNDKQLNLTQYEKKNFLYTHCIYYFTSEILMNADIVFNECVLYRTTLRIWRRPRTTKKCRSTSGKEGEKQ